MYVCVYMLQLTKSKASKRGVTKNYFARAVTKYCCNSAVLQNNLSFLTYSTALYTFCTHCKQSPLGIL